MRLEALICVNEARSTYPLFLFQTGAIRRVSQGLLISGLSLFLFQTGAIRSVFVNGDEFVPGDVSIPNWCD